MKRIALSMLFAFVCISTISAQPGHIPIPVPHNHDSHICYGYATARAAGKDSGDAECDAWNLYQFEINTSYFDWHSGASLDSIAKVTL